MSDGKHVLTSPLAAWPGEIHLPLPDHFSGAAWQVWAKGMKAPKRKNASMVHAYGYTGLELVKSFGEWHIENAGLEEVMAWETRPADERTKLIAWIGKQMMTYIDGIIDPKG